MDELDRKLIALLRDNARMSVASLSKKLGVTQGTVHNRLSDLPPIAVPPVTGKARG